MPERTERKPLPFWFKALCGAAVLLEVVLVGWLGIEMLGLAFWIALGVGALGFVVDSYANPPDPTGPLPGTPLYEWEMERRRQLRHEELLRAIHEAGGKSTGGTQDNG